MEQHCPEEILSAYLDGDLESEEAGRTAEHIAECAVCRRVLAQVRTIRDGAAGMDQLTPPDRTWGAIRERIRDSRARSRRQARLWWVAVPALAATLLVVVLVGHVRVPGLRAKGIAAAAPELSRQQVAEETARDYQEYVHGIDLAIDECRTALDENPGNARVRAAYSGARSDREGAMDRLVSGGE